MQESKGVSELSVEADASSTLSMSCRDLLEVFGTSSGVLNTSNVAVISYVNIVVMLCIETRTHQLVTKGVTRQAVCL